MVAPGWYQDPDGGGWRWWDGTQWGKFYDEARIGAVTPGSASPFGLLSYAPLDLGIDFSSGWPLRLTKLVAVGAGAAAVVAGAVLVSFLAGPLPDVLATLLLVVAVPLLVVGQLVIIGILNGRMVDRHRAAGGTLRWWRRRSTVGDIRGGLPWPALVVAAVLFYGVVGGLFISTAASFALGGTTGELPGVVTEDPSRCEYTMDNHGEYRCLTEAEHDRQQLAGQLFATAIFFGFFVGHCTVATGEILRQRQLSDTVG